MSRFDDLIANRVRPGEDYAEDMTLDLPSQIDPRAEQRQEEEYEREQERHEVATEVVEAERDAVGQRGGSSAADNPDQQASAPEAMPQRDEPDEGEHASSQPAEEEPVVEPEPEPEAPEPEPEPVQVDDELQVEPEPVESAEQRERYELPAPHRPEGMEDLVWKHTYAFRYEQAPQDAEDGKVKYSHIKTFPAELVDVLRLQLRPFGAEFADSISIPSLVTAFVAAQIGADLDVDEATMQATKAFRLLAPEIAALEQRLSGAEGELASMSKEVGGLRKEMRAVTEVLGSVELTNALLLADRFEAVIPPGSTVKTLELRHPKVLGARNTLRKAVKDQGEADKLRARHP